MIGPQIFQVATEFRFEVGSAVANSQLLQGAVENISRAADNTLFSFQKMGLGIASQLGLGSGSLLGILGAAIQSSDKFGQSQRQFANIMSSNLGHLTGSVTTFEERMASSAGIMQKINKLAQEFSLPSGELLEMSKLLAATLVPKGLAGTNFSTAIDLSRNFLKSAPTLGVDPGLARGQLLDLIQGRANMGDTLFQRLMNETQAFKPFNKQGGPQGFNALPAPERVALVSRALKQFSSDMDVLKGNAMSLSGEMMRIGEAIKGPFSVFKSLGDSLLVPVLKLLRSTNNALQLEGRAFIDSFAKFLGPLIEDPENFLVNVLQLRKLKADTGLAGTGLGVIGIFTGIVHTLKFLGIETAVARTGLTLLGGTLGFVGGAALTLFGILSRAAMFLTGTTTAFGAVWSIMNGLTVVASRVFVPFALLLGLFQLLSRAKAIAHVDDAKAFLTLTPAFMESLTRLKTIVGGLVQPFADLFDKMASGISPIFRMSYYFDLLIKGIDLTSTTILLFSATFQGLIFGIMETVSQIESFFSGGGFDSAKIGAAFSAGIDEMISRNLEAIKNGTGATVQQTTNIAKVEIRNEFKDQMEPDRIAFTLKEQLLKAANNPGQATGRVFQGSF